MPWSNEDFEWILTWLREGNTSPRYLSNSVLETVLTLLDPEKDTHLMIDIHNELYKHRGYRKSRVR